MFTSQSLTRSGALNVNTGCQERVRVRGHRGRGVHGWMVSVIVSEQERSWEAVSGGPESLSCFRAPLSGSSPALAAGRTFLVHEAHVHHRKGDGSGCQRGVTWTPAPPTTIISQRRHQTTSCPSHMQLWGKCPPQLSSPGLGLRLYSQYFSSST